MRPAHGPFGMAVFSRLAFVESEALDAYWLHRVESYRRQLYLRAADQQFAGSFVLSTTAAP